MKLYCVLLLLTACLAEMEKIVTSNMCKKCIDQGKLFCPDSRLLEGNCCEEGD